MACLFGGTRHKGNRSSHGSLSISKAIIIRANISTARQLTSATGTTFAGARTTLHYEPALTSNVLTELQPLLRPGDVLLVPAEQKLTAAIIPSFWAHAAIYLGMNEHLRGLSLQLPPASSFHPTLQPNANTPLVVEAIAPRVVINSLANSLYADQVLVLRWDTHGNSP